ncbi:MAG: hypothetical protein IJM34_09705 [Lachnospiraceae bacterium]|nr:hypothetical protein [Lachnospiraceae bacterium]
MRDYVEKMKKRAADLEKAIDTAIRQSDGFPDGRLRISQSGRQVRYYQVLSNDNNSGEYITKDKRDIIKKLAQKDYSKQFITEARRELSILKQCIRMLEESDADLSYQMLPETRKQWVEPYILTDELYAKRWEEQVFKTNTFAPEAKIYETKKGEKVRSKSEAIIADILSGLGIPYHYEQALVLKDKSVKYPDFTLLRVRTGEVIYLEHLGLLDDEQYRIGCMKKLEEYRSSGIYPGKNLLITYESKETPLDISGTRKMLKNVLL